MSRLLGLPLNAVLTTVLLFGTLQLGLLSCSSSLDPAEIRFGLAGAPITLDPRYATDATSSRINRLLYRQLVDFDSASHPIASLASWEKISSKQYRFRLQEKSRIFHDGSLLTAEDVKATYMSILDKQSGSPLRATFRMIDKIVIVDNDTIDFFLKYADPIFPGYLEIGILPAEKIKSNYAFDHHPVGSGPFRFVEWNDPNSLRLERIKDHQPILFLTVKDQNTRVLKLMHGELDMIQNDIDSEIIRYLGARRELKVLVSKGSNFAYLGFNMQDKTVSQLKVREAIAYAIDRKSIIQYLFAGKARLAASLLTPDHWAGHPNLDQYRYAPEQARKRLASLGYSTDNPLHLVYKTSNNPFRIRLATVIQSQLAQVGIQVELRTYDWGTFYGDIRKGNFQMYSLSWVGINLPDIFRHVFYSSSVPPQGANRGHFRNQDVDELLDQVQRAQDLSVQTGLYRRVQEILHQTLPYVPLWYEDQIAIMRNSVDGYEIHIDGNYDGLCNVYRVKSLSDSH